MARYTDVDALLNELPDDLPYKASVKRVLIQAPEADVVPKSEVAKEFTCFVGDPHKVEHCPYLDEIENAKAEVAREIFEEMFEKLNHIVITADVGVEYNTFKKTIKQVCAAVSAELAELKKKYTEKVK